MLGVNMADVFAALQTYLGSTYVNDFNLLGRVFRVTAQADAAYRLDAKDVLKIRVRNSSGDTVPLGSFTTVRDQSGPYRVPRYNLYPAAELDGAPAPGFSQGQAIELMQKLAAETLPQGISFEWTTLAYPAAAGRQHRGVRVRAGGGVRVPGARGPVREPDAAAGGDPDRADVPHRLHHRRDPARHGQQHPDPGRLHRADRACRQERHPDRRVRQAARGPGPRPLGGGGRGGAAAAAADPDDLARLHLRRRAAGVGDRGRRRAAPGAGHGGVLRA